MEHTVLVANPVITGRTVLQVVVVAILLEVGPLGSHLRRSLGEDILSLQPMAVILLVDGSNILVKAVERFQQAVFVTQQVGCLTQLSVGLEAAENEDILLRCCAITSGITPLSKAGEIAPAKISVVASTKARIFGCCMLS
ncbi:MAG: hypothetical protein V8T16_03660 [Parabacteroides merdae]